MLCGYETQRAADRLEVQELEQLFTFPRALAPTRKNAISLLMDIPQVSPADAADLLEKGYIYIDVRSMPEFEQGHPEGSINIPLVHADPAMGMVPNSEFLSVFQAVIPKDSQFVLGCASSGRSLRAAAVLVQNGWENVVVQRAGFSGARDPMSGTVLEPGWADAGLPVAQGDDDGSYDAQRKKAGLD